MVTKDQVLKAAKEMNEAKLTDAIKTTAVTEEALRESFMRAVEVVYDAGNGSSIPKPVGVVYNSLVDELEAKAKAEKEAAKANGKKSKSEKTDSNGEKGKGESDMKAEKGKDKKGKKDAGKKDETTKTKKDATPAKKDAAKKDAKVPAKKDEGKKKDNSKKAAEKSAPKKMGASGNIADMKSLLAKKASDKEINSFFTKKYKEAGVTDEKFISKRIAIYKRIASKK